ncbi:MAG: hypothetical protein M1827_004655 [Pycnora praestabilis]|nr:MAG: hypothetical protein M1827_004655 [Pycnora praestabilis]
MTNCRILDEEAVSDSPAKRRRVRDGDPQNYEGYDSQRDSGDDLFNGYETVATMPLAQALYSQNPATETSSSPLTQGTQPTQLIDRSASSVGESGQKSSIVQVAASSPLRTESTESPLTSRQNPKLGGVLSNAMAPAGTRFRLPFGVRKEPPKPQTVDIMDDDIPAYRGDSSDENGVASRKADIKPSIFDRNGKSSSRVDGALKVKSEGPSSGGNRFEEITKKSFYKPLNASTRPSTLSGSVYDSRNRDEGTISSKLAVSAKNNVDVLADAYGSSTRPGKQSRQTRPARAQPVEEETLLQDISDYQIREKATNIINVFPDASPIMCRNALVTRKGNYEDALELVASLLEARNAIDLTGSGDEGTTSQEKKFTDFAKATNKRQITVPNRSIQDKWSSTQAPLLNLSPSPKPSPASIPQKRKRKLVQGRKAPSSPVIESPPPRAKIIDTDSDSDSGVASASEEDTQLEGKVLAFFNTCSTAELADISNSDEKTAAIIMSQKPFSNLDQVRQVTAVAPSTNKKKQSTKAIGTKIVDTCLEMWSGYEAIDDLVARCDNLARPVAEEMKKWGFNVFGATKSGELELTVLDPGQATMQLEAQCSVRDSGFGTPTNSTVASGEDDAEEGQRVARSIPVDRQDSDGFIAQPSIMSRDIELKDYQIVGLNWLALLFAKDLSCILADEMGLGKTCQVIAFLAHLLEKGIKGPHLVVVPGSTLENWLREFRTFCPTLVVEPYYGALKDRAFIRERIDCNKDRINVVVTTYDLAAKGVDGKWLRHLKPVACVYDEGHYLKNASSKRYETLMRIPAKFRLLLTGTPLQNNLQELASLLAFILPSVFKDRKEDLSYIFKYRAKTTDDNHAALLSTQRIARAKSMMMPFILRRKKYQVLKHLPGKFCRVEYCKATDSQQEIYAAELLQARKAFEARSTGKKPDKESGNVMMQLRKAAIHPLLFRRIFDDGAIRKMSKACLKEDDLRECDANTVLEDMEWMTDFELHTFCGKYPNTMAKYALQHQEWMDSGKVNKLCELLPRFKEGGDRVLVFSQFTMVMDILEVVMEDLGMQFFRLDGRTKIEERQDMIDEFCADESITVFLLSTKAGGAGINLASANKVIIFDSSFNPQEDIQAENRAHRVGQTREVEVIRLVTRNTIEEQIHTLGESKLALDYRVSGEGTANTDEKQVENEGETMVEEMLREKIIANDGIKRDRESESASWG